MHINQLALPYDFTERIEEALKNDSQYAQQIKQTGEALGKIKAYDKALWLEVEAHTVAETSRVSDVCCMTGFQDGMSMILNALQGKPVIKDLRGNGDEPE